MKLAVPVELTKILFSRVLCHNNTQLFINAGRPVALSRQYDSWLKYFWNSPGRSLQFEKAHKKPSIF